MANNSYVCSVHPIVDDKGEHEDQVQFYKLAEDGGQELVHVARTKKDTYKDGPVDKLPA